MNFKIPSTTTEENNGYQKRYNSLKITLLVCLPYDQFIKQFDL